MSPWPAQRAAWVWDQPAPGELAQWAQAGAVRDLFVATPVRWRETGRLEWVRQMHAGLAGRARLHALGGDRDWLDEPQAARAWLTTAESAGLFTGPHLDLEPWQHRDWDRDRAAVVAAYLAVIEDLAGASGLPLEVDVSFWLHGVASPSGGRLLDALLDRVPSVTVLAYRQVVTGPDSITELARPTVAAARARGARCRVGVETRDLGPDPVSRKQTFFGRPRSELDRALEQVDGLLGGWAGWAGLAVHDRAGWVALPGGTRGQ